MKHPLHKCPLPGCEVMVQKNVVMCSPHWAMVPEVDARAVWATWRDFRRAATSEGQHEAARSYRFACHRAVDTVQDQLNRKKVNR